MAAVCISNAAAIAAGCGGDGGAGPTGIDEPPAGTTRFALVDVTVVPMDAQRHLPAHTVVIEDGRITAVGPSDRVSIPAGMHVVEAPGRYVMPGLVDMHVHVHRDDLLRYLEYGVTAVRNMRGTAEALAMMQEIEAGTLAGPRIVSVSETLDGSPPSFPYMIPVAGPEDASAAVDAQLRAGYRTLKLYDRLEPAAYAAIVEAAGARGMRVVGHVPWAVGLPGAFAAGQASVEHLTGYEQALHPRGRVGIGAWLDVPVQAMDALAADTREAGAWNCPTLIVFLARAAEFSFTASDRSRIQDNRRRMVAALHRAGAPLLLGSDAGAGVPAGAGLIAEIGEFAAAGVPAYETLRAATAVAAEFLGLENELGIIAPGMLADLLLLDRDPLADATAVYPPHLVIAAGRPIRTRFESLLLADPNI